VEKRCVTTERPIACLLSGGLDSSLIAALVVEYHKLHNLPVVETYSIGLEGSVDLEYARTMANYLGTKHTEIVLTEEDFLNAIPEVIKSIESYDTTSVRASIGNWLLGKYIAENSDAKVIFNGDGSDELTGGYLYMHKAPDMIEFDGECRRLLKDIHAFDVLRSDKSISSHGLEPRTPFLDRTWVQYYLSIPLHVRYHPNENNCEKYLLRTAFSKDYYETFEGRELLPHKVLWRKKEAFSDGVSKHTRSLYQIIQEYTEEKMRNEDYKNAFFTNMKKLNDHFTYINEKNICNNSISISFTI
jgi:asparagine synthase (glutamine-hydrolysing)